MQKVSFKPTIDGCRPIPSDDILPVTVEITTKIPITIQYVTVYLETIGECTLSKVSSPSAVSAPKDPLLYHQFPHLYNHCSGPALKLHTGGYLTQSTSHIIRNTLRMPSKVPETWSFYRDEIKAFVINRLKFVMAYLPDDDSIPGDLNEMPRPVLMCEYVPLNVRNELVLYSRLKPSVGSLICRTMFGRLVLPHPRVRRGTDLFIEVYMNNLSCWKIRNITLTLYKVYLLTDTTNSSNSQQEYERTIWQKVKTETLPNVPPHSRWERRVTGFMVPLDCGTNRTTADIQFAHLYFSIRLKAKVAPFRYEKCWLDFIIVSEDRMSQPESDLQKYCVLRPDEG